MGLLSLAVKREERASVVPGLHPKDPALFDMWGGINSKAGQNVTSDTALQTSSVYACVTLISETLAMLPTSVKAIRADGGFDILQDHRLYKLLHNRPNRWQSDFEFYQMMQGHKLLRGNAYAKIVMHPGRGLNELAPMHPDRVWPFVVTPNGSTYYMYDFSPMPPAGSKLFYQYFPQNADTEILLQEEVLHIRGYTANGIVGINPIRYAAGREAVGLALAAEEQGARLLANGAKIQAAVKYPGRLDDTTYNRMKKDMTERLNSTNGENWFKPFFMEEGMDIVELGMTMVDAQYLETRNFQVEDIARIFRVPLLLVGHGEKSPTYASSEQFLIAFKIFTLQPHIVAWEKAMERDLLYPSEINKIKIDIDLDDIMRGDTMARASYLMNRFRMASITPNGVRLYEGENPATDEGANKLYILNQMVPLKDAGIRMTSKVEAAGETVKPGLADQGGTEQ